MEILWFYAVPPGTCLGRSTYNNATTVSLPIPRSSSASDPVTVRCFCYLLLIVSLNELNKLMNQSINLKKRENLD